MLSGIFDLQLADQGFVSVKSEFADLTKYNSMLTCQWLSGVTHTELAVMIFTSLSNSGLKMFSTKFCIGIPSVWSFSFNWKYLE